MAGLLRNNGKSAVVEAPWRICSSTTAKVPLLKLSQAGLLFNKKVPLLKSPGLVETPGLFALHIDG
ncbi:hypothetical protein [Paenibacillus graminis]|uniref:hypothetical protein n=1 Tax=Paenibacillus graminis TaxID=189425 RepID=UPI002DBE9ED1|nr:hypothetical protein [Paenibacillus graminis]MEC0169839.1 hypothetical protein [Paenibacillus graminis]